MLSVAVLTFAVGCAGGQKKADEKPTGPTIPSYFEEIPSNTVFFFGGAEPVPEEFTRATLEYFDGMVKASTRPGRRAEFIKAEMGGTIDMEGLAELGLSPTPRFAFYSYGFTPVMRFSLADASKFQSFVETYAQQYGLEFEERSHDGKKYFLVDEGDNSVIYRFSKTEFVLAVVADADLEAFVPHFFGTKKPAQSLAAKDEFTEMTERYGFERSIGGYVDYLRFAGIAAGNVQMEGDPANFVENGPIHPGLEGDCKAEFARMAAWTPRFVMGFREYSDEKVDVAMGTVLDPELAKEVRNARGEVPGYGSKLFDTALMTIGLGLDVGGAISAGSSWARQVQQEPFQCRRFEEANIYAQQLIAMGGQAPPAVSGLRGYSAVLDSVRINYDEASGTTYQPSVVTALSSRDPETLLMFASQMAPMLQSIQLKANGEPVVVEPLNQAYPGIVQATALMTTDFIGVAMGPEMSDALSEMLQGEKAESPPFFTVRARTGEAISTMVSDLRAIIDNAAKDKKSRNLTEEDIVSARKYVDRIEGIFPDEEQTFEVSVTLEEDAVFMNYADSGPDLDTGWISKFDEESEREARALMKVLGYQNRYRQKPLIREKAKPESAPPESGSKDTGVEAEEAPSAGE